MPAPGQEIVEPFGGMIGQAELTNTTRIISAERRIKDAVGDPVFAEQLRVARRKAEGIEYERALSVGLWWAEMRWRAKTAQPRPPIDHLKAAIAAACTLPTFNECLEMARGG